MSISEARDLHRPRDEKLEESFLVRLIRRLKRPEQPASVGNVSEITVAGLMGVNTVADGERPRPVQQKGYSTGENLGRPAPH